jgi:hypothetical protein
MTMGIIEGLTSVIGQALTELRGYQITRTTALARPAFQVVEGLASLDFDGVDAVTLTSGDFGTAAIGDTVRVLSGPARGAEGTITAVGGPAAVTAILQSGGATVGAFTGADWEVERPAETTLNVESTLGFPDSGVAFTVDGVDYMGRLVIDEVIYYYTGRTNTTFTGLVHDNGEGSLVSGILKEHQPLAIVEDYSLSESDLDIYRRSFLINYATGEDLTTVARTVGVNRPPELADDDLFRALVKAIAYAPRGTIYAIELALEAILGAGNYEIFENLTIASQQFGQGDLQDGGEVFIDGAGTGAQPENPYGKTWLDGYEQVLTASAGASTLTISPDDILTVAGVRTAPETSEVTVAESTGSTLISSSSGGTVNFNGSPIPVYVYPGDMLRITSGPFEGATATILTRGSPSLVTTGFVRGWPFLGVAPDGLVDASWEIFRTSDRFGYYRPSNVIHLEGGATRNPWAWMGTGPGETPSITLYTADATFDTGAGFTGNASYHTAYARAARVQPEDVVSFEGYVAIDSSATGSDFQGIMAILDGARAIIVSIEESGTNAVVRFSTTAGVNIGSAVFGPGYNTFFHVKIQKNGEDNVQLILNGEVVQEADYTDFSTVGDWATAFDDANYTSADREFVFGGMAADGFIVFKEILWSSEPKRDWFNRQLSGATASGDQIADTFTAADVGRFLTIKDFADTDANGANALGLWEITAESGSAATVRGRELSTGFFTNDDQSRFLVDDGFPFVWPDHQSHSIEILSGPNAGTYPIVDVLDPVTFLPYDPGPLGVAGYTSKNAIRFRQRSNAVLLDTSARPFGVFAVGETDVEWRIVPNFPSHSSVTGEVADAGSESGGVVTLPAALPFPSDTLMEVYYSKVESGYLFDPTVRNALVSLSPLEYEIYPAYLYDDIGFARTVVDILTAAGVIPDFSRFFRDSAGPHIGS